MINLYTNSTIGSYTTGTVTCTKNSANVTGSGTTWSEIVNPGDILTLNDDKLYVIKTVNSNTSITLDKAFAENTVSNSAYRIFLNTAAHFPSDTAAKVERALEQLSDINEAAINNDRTVTAATKVNGKGIESTTGYINLNPPSVNSNDGGSIRFHYNQSSSATSKIYEDAPGQIKIDANVNFSKHLISPLYKMTSAVSRGVNTDGTVNHHLIRNIDANTKDISVIYEEYKYNSASDYNNAIGLYVYDPTENTSTNSKARIQVGYNQNGAWTYAPTPAKTDDSSKIATTSYVQSNLSLLDKAVRISRPDITRGDTATAVQSNRYDIEALDSTGSHVVWGLYNDYKVTDASTYSNRLAIYVFPPNTTSNSSGATGINITKTQDNVIIEASATPSVASDDKQIATTAYVKDCVPKSVGSSTNPVYTNSNGVVTACNNTDLMYALINALTTGTSNPSMADYIITQYAGGGTSNTTYYRRSISNLWNTCKAEVDSITLEYNTGFKPYGGVSSRKPTFYKWGRIVWLAGAVSPDGEAAEGSGTLFTAPSGYRPARDVYALCQGSGKAYWLLHILTGGAVQYERYGIGESQATIPAGAWMPFGPIMYFVP